MELFNNDKLPLWVALCRATDTNAYIEIKDKNNETVLILDACHTSNVGAKFYNLLVKLEKVDYYKFDKHIIACIIFLENDMASLHEIRDKRS